MPKLKITLIKEYNKRTKKVDVLLDDQVIATIFNGETKEFDIAPGQHKIQIKNGWYGSREAVFSARENELKAFDVSIFKYGNIVLTSILAVLVLHLIASTFFDIKYLIWLNIPAFLIMAYYLTFGKNDYLVIKESQQ